MKSEDQVFSSSGVYDSLGGADKCGNINGSTTYRVMTTFPDWDEHRLLSSID